MLEVRRSKTHGFFRHVLVPKAPPEVSMTNLGCHVGVGRLLLEQRSASAQQESPQHRLKPDTRPGLSPATSATRLPMDRGHVGPEALDLSLPSRACSACELRPSGARARQ